MAGRRHSNAPAKMLYSSVPTAGGLHVPAAPWCGDCSVGQESATPRPHAISPCKTGTRGCTRTELLALDCRRLGRLGRLALLLVGCLGLGVGLGLGLVLVLALIVLVLWLGLELA